MGLGDQLIATGLARGAKDRGKRIAFGDRRRIIWDLHSEQIFKGNPNIARPGSERDGDLEWIEFYKGNRLYNAHDKVKQRWIWNTAFHSIPGQVFFDQAERRNARRLGSGFIVIEPSVARWKDTSRNKDWGWRNYQEVATRLLDDGYRVVQFSHRDSGRMLGRVETVSTLSFRDGLGLLSRAALYIGPEGGLHHGAAAVGTSAVVLFGGFIPPSVTGYDMHDNLTGGAEACGSLLRCDHCAAALAAISVDEVYRAARERL